MTDIWIKEELMAELIWKKDETNAKIAVEAFTLMY